MLVSLLFDTEDYTSPEALGMDDICGWLARIMTEEGVTGTFLVIPQKARALADRGRTDVIAAMRDHEIGLHTGRGSEHPTVVECLEGCGWDDGVERAFAIERAGIETLESVFETRITACSRHGASWAPQFVAACGKLDRPVVYSHAAPPSVGVGWYAGTLNLRPWIEVLERDYSEPGRLEPRLESLDQRLTEAAEREPWIGVFGGHPAMFKAKQFWDSLNYVDGTNRPRPNWRAPDCRSDEEMDRAREGFRTLVRFVRDHPSTEMAPVAELARRMRGRRDSVPRAELVDLAQKALDTGAEDVFGYTILCDETLSPAQQVVGFARALMAPDADTLPMDEPLGPVESPLRGTGGDLAWSDLREIAVALDHAARSDGRLPGNLTAGRRTIGLGGAYFALAAALGKSGDTNLGFVSPDFPDSPPEFPYFAPQYPSYGNRIANAFANDVVGWPIHKPHIDLDEMVRLTRLMAWTLRRPAVLTR